MSGRAELTVLGPDRMAYEEAFEEQVRLRDDCIASGGARSYLVLLEHPPTITVGRSGKTEEVLTGERRLAEQEVALVETNRGGRVTFHGPGQLVGYPIIHLGRRGLDLHRYMRDLETWLVKLCRSFGVEAHADSPHTGVWVGDRKIASIGIAARRWVTYHGVALNVDADLDWFRLIVPCGLSGVEMTSLEKELGAAPPFQEVALRAADVFCEHFEMRRAVTTGGERRIE